MDELRAFLAASQIAKKVEDLQLDARIAAIARREIAAHDAARLLKQYEEALSKQNCGKCSHCGK